MADGPPAPREEFPPKDQELAREVAGGNAKDRAEPAQALAQTRVDDARTNLAQKRWVAPWLATLMTVQVLIADVGFFAYGIRNKWDIDAAVMHSWLGAAVIQVIALTTIVVKHLYPPKDR